MKDYIYDIMHNSGNLSIDDIALRIIVAAGLGVAIYISYKITHSGTIYSKKFNITLLTLTVLTATVMTVIGNNIALSLGMVGALSIIRFRTSIKDSRDTAYIFWTIIVGICCGVGDFAVAGIGSAVVFVVLLLFGRVINENRMLIIIRVSRSKSNEIRKVLFDYFNKPPVLKAENTTENTVEMIYEINRRMFDAANKKNDAVIDADRRTLIDRLYEIKDVQYVNIVVQSDEIS